MEIAVFAWMIALAAALLGYVTGRRAGMRRGRREAVAEAPLRLRQQAFTSGTCPVCDRGAATCYNVETEVMG